MSTEFWKVSKNVAEHFERIGIVGLLGMFFVTVLDVAGAKFFQRPVSWALEIVCFSQLVAIASATGAGLFVGVHLKIDVFGERHPSLKRIVDLFVSTACLGFFVVIFLAALKYAHSLQKSGEMGSVSKIPLFPFAYFFSATCLPVIFFYVSEILRLLKKRNESR